MLHLHQTEIVEVLVCQAVVRMTMSDLGLLPLARSSFHRIQGLGTGRSPMQIMCDSPSDAVHM